MKTVVARELANQSSAILAWLQAGESVELVEDGETLGRILPEKVATTVQRADRHALFERRFAPLESVPERDLTGIVSENRGEL